MFFVTGILCHQLCRSFLALLGLLNVLDHLLVSYNLLGLSQAQTVKRIWQNKPNLQLHMLAFQQFTKDRFPLNIL